jgi:hypothetical protein
MEIFGYRGLIINVLMRLVQTGHSNSECWEVACAVGKSQEHNGQQEQSRQGDYFVAFGTMIEECVSD